MLDFTFNGQACAAVIYLVGQDGILPRIGNQTGDRRPLASETLFSPLFAACRYWGGLAAGGRLIIGPGLKVLSNTRKV